MSSQPPYPMTTAAAISEGVVSTYILFSTEVSFVHVFHSLFICRIFFYNGIIATASIVSFVLFSISVFSTDPFFATLLIAYCSQVVKLISFHKILLFAICMYMLPWCSGQHACLASGRSVVRIPVAVYIDEDMTANCEDKASHALGFHDSNLSASHEFKFCGRCFHAMNKL